MIPTMLSVRNRLALALCIPLLLGAADDSLRQRAFDLYDAGRFNEARGLLERLESAGEADGIALYRLFYCRRLIQDPKAGPTLERARELLEQATGSAPDLDAYFYLANAYLASEREDDARRVAAEATRKVEQGELSSPATPPGMFRLGKLYADQERETDAERWYGRAVDGFEAADPTEATLPYLLWASSYLAERAYEGERYGDAASYFGRILGRGSGSLDQWDRYAASLAWTGRYEEAGRAWRRAAGLGPGQSDRAHYGSAVAERAASTGTLPDTAPDGRAWTELDQAELEQVLAEQAGEVRTALAWARKVRYRMNFVERQALERQITEARRLFLGAALQFVLRGYPLREKAFAGGYAGLIFRERAWRIRVGRRPSAAR